MLEPSWVSDNHARFDVFHIHFGFDAIGTQTLTEITHELKMHHKPLVYTVHDLRNPHHREPAAHTEQQQVLIAAAQALITLTHGAAQYISHHWNRDSTVLPHPHVLSSAVIDQPRPSDAAFVVGVHVKSLRANMDPLPVLDALAPAVARLPGAVLQINVHDEIFDPDSHWYAPAMGDALLAYRRYRHVRVRVHRYFTDEKLWQYLASLSVSVLPYRFGTHSGWLEASYDLGTAVIAPSCGFYHQQRPCDVFEFTESSFDEASLRQALHQAYVRWDTGIPAPRATWKQRLSERVQLAHEHFEIYKDALR